MSKTGVSFQDFEARVANVFIKYYIMQKNINYILYR